MSPLIHVDPIHPQAELISQAARILHAGGLVAFPTETVYGLGANAFEANAVEKIFKVKRRPSHNPLIVHVHGVEAAQRLVRTWPVIAEKLGNAFWPGPLTLVLPKRQEVPDIVTAGVDSVALRVPAHPVALAMLELSRLPVAAPSANRSTQLSPTTAQHVEKSLGDDVDLILDGGATILGIESTVIDLSGKRPMLLRPGIISCEELQSIIGHIDVPEKTFQDSVPRRSPGMLDRHYAPRAVMVLFHPDMIGRVQDLVEKERAGGGIVGALLLTSPDLSFEHPIPMPSNPLSYARLLYASLHSLDDLGCTLVLVEKIPEDSAWAAISDRLKRASSQGKVIT
jgi:L-threonylcarbamoyladenylate synthase